MDIHLGRFEGRRTHHSGWLRLFRFESGGFELWVGSRYVTVTY